MSDDLTRRHQHALHKIDVLEDYIEELKAERDEALNQLDSAWHSVAVLEKRVAGLLTALAELKGQDDE